MIKQIVGFQRVEYDKKDGTGHVSGAHLYIAVPIPQDRGDGIAVERVYVGSKRLPSPLMVGDYDIEYDVDYQGKGYISRIVKI